MMALCSLNVHPAAIRGRLVGDVDEVKAARKAIFYPNPRSSGSAYDDGDVRRRYEDDDSCVQQYTADFSSMQPIYQH